MISAKVNKVYFFNEQIKSFFDKLEKGTFGEKELYILINHAIDDLEENPRRYIQIPKERWPKECVKNYGVNNLWKYDLLNGWRLIYTLRHDKVEIMSIVIEWFTHKDYEKRFGY
ncbi:MAG: hypothetical protein PHF68_03490 [Candidatus ainarchaeum sp.]|nr:hypothetical protein [Candidatus ainarchaeum sp.]